MRPRWWLFVGLVLLAASEAGAGSRTGPVRIGVLAPSFGLSPHAAGLRDGLAALGYREDADFVLVVRFAEGEPVALQRTVAELIWMGADVIVAAGATPALAARHMTQRIPIVFAGVTDPVGLGLVDHVERPGGNVTGVADDDAAVAIGRILMFRSLVPGMKRVLYVHDGHDPHSLALARAYRGAGERLGLEVVDRAVRSEKEADLAFAHIGTANVHGIIGPTYTSFNLAGHVLDAARRRRLPTVGSTAFWAEVGALMSFGADFRETGRQAAQLVDRIVKGERPAQIPVLLNSKIELSVNVETARALGLSIAPEVLEYVDRIFR
jgi:putative ABC transport system substrate-binding protein